ncbi:MAG: alginate export family protein [Vicinamibacterales bacterium]
MSPTRRLVLGVAVVCGAFHATPEATQDAPSPAATADNRAPGETSFLVENVTRAELWRFFTPPPGGGAEPDYAFIGNRSTLGARYRGSRWSFGGAIQYVRLENLPRGAIGPGLLGTGGAYFFQAAGTFSYQFYLRGLSATLSSTDGSLAIDAGRLSIDEPSAAGASDTPVERLARERVSGRLLGDMPGTLYQRAWDGVRARLARGTWRATAVAALPTQGTFEESANLPLDRVRVVALDVVREATAPTPLRAHGFASVYRDTRQVRARPDNTGLLAPAVDLTIVTGGASVVAAADQGPGRWDVVAWAALQGGGWYGQPHRAGAAALEGGYRWRTAWRPWLRTGVFYASGDADAGDDRHHTFFPLLPSGDQYVASNTFALMNVVDAWAAVRLSPHPRLDVASELHRVGLASGADRWYFGSGATERRGNYFGYLGRQVGAARDLGTIAEARLAWRATRWWTVRGYLGRFLGGDAVRHAFAGDRLTTGWVESVLRF